MNLGSMVKAFDALVALRDVTRRFKPPSNAGPREPETSLTSPATGQLETRLTNVVVAALKEAFDRDHARLELERTQLEEQRRRAEDALRLEQRRQEADRELSRLRLLAALAMVGWIASILLLGWRLPLASPASRAVLGLGWLFLLGALGASFTAMGRVGEKATSLPIWLLIAGLGFTAVTLLM